MPDNLKNDNTYEPTLQDTVTGMTSPDYKERFKAEYIQTSIRYTKLLCMMKNWDDGILNFTPTCPYSIYELQLRSMKDYLAVLEARAKLENIDLNTHKPTSRKMKKGALKFNQLTSGPQFEQLIVNSVECFDANQDLILIEEMTELTKEILKSRRGCPNSDIIKEELSHVLMSLYVYADICGIKQGDIEKESSKKLSKYADLFRLI